MKICPRCKMRLDAENECPMCHTTITYEPKVCEQKEKYIFNKYLLSHLIKNSWYSIVCFIIVLIRFVINPHFSGKSIYITLLLCISIFASLFQRKFSKYLQWKYSKDYSEYAANYTKIVSGGLAVLLSFFLT